MMSWSTSALLLLVGIGAGPSGLNLLSSPLLLLLDPFIVMALGMLGVFIGLGLDPRRPQPTAPAMLAVLGGIVMVTMRDATAFTLVLDASGIAGVAIVVAFAGWLLVGRADSEREQQVFVIGSLLLVGGGAAYASLSAVFAGLLAGIVWNLCGGLARARIVRHLDYFQHPLLVVMLLVAGASLTFSLEAVAVVVIVAALHAVGRPVVDPFQSRQAQPRLRLPSTCSAERFGDSTPGGCTHRPRDGGDSTAPGVGVGNARGMALALGLHSSSPW